MSKILPMNNSFTQENLRKHTSSSSVKLQRCMFNTTNPYRVRWDIAIIMLALYNSLVIPYQLSFSEQSELYLLDTIIDFIFLLDIFVNLRTTYFDLKSGSIVDDPCLIAKEYALSGRLFIDTLAAIPIDLIIQNVSNLKLLKVLKLLRIIRLSKLIIILRVKHRVKESFNIAKLILFILIYLHFLACAWNAIVSINDTWMSDSNDEIHRYAFSLYFAICTFAGIEINPTNYIEYFFAALAILMGALILSYMLGGVAYSINSLNKERTKLFEHIAQINSTLKTWKIPGDLQLEVIEYATSTYKVAVNSQDWLSFQRVVAPSLLKLVNQQLFEGPVLSQPVLQDLSEFLVNNFEYKVARPQEIVIEAGEPASFFMIIIEGTMELSIKNLDHKVAMRKLLKKGDFCGEIGLVFNVPRTATIESVINTSIGVLPAVKFMKMLKRFPDTEQKLREHVSNYTDPITVKCRQQLSRIGYLCRLDALNMDKLVYSLSYKTVKGNTYLIEEGSEINSVMFIERGTVEIRSFIFDPNVLGIKNRRERDVIPIPQPRNRRSSYISAGILNKQNLYSFPVSQLGPNSIMCAYISILDEPLGFTIKTLEDCVIKTLPTQIIERFISKEMIKKKYLHSTMFDEAIVVPPALDYFDTHHNRTKHLLHRLRNVAFMIIKRRRVRKSFRFHNFKGIVKRLQAIIEARDKGLDEISHLIESGKINPDVIDVAHLLSTSEISQPIMAQIATVVSQTKGSIDFITRKYQHLSSLIEDLNLKRGRVRKMVEDLL